MTHDTAAPGKRKGPGQSALSAWLLPAGFLLLAAALFAFSSLVPVPIPPPATIDPASLVVAPRRVAMTDPPRIPVEGRPESCNACHQIFTSSHPAGAELSFHQEIDLVHGMNNRCLNCHDEANREKLTLRDGTAISFADTPLLCAQCHGTAYRDWERGTHGKTLGSWLTGSPEQMRLSCNECHDPHSPRFPPMPPLPGPNTLRMGSPGEHGHGPHASPLQQWLGKVAADAHDAGGEQ